MAIGFVFYWNTSCNDEMLSIQAFRSFHNGENLDANIQLKYKLKKKKA